MEAEYIALSQGMQELLPAKRLLEELVSALEFENEPLSTVSTVLEENNGSSIIAPNPMPCMTLCSKNIAVKYHWFYSQVNGLTMQVKAIDSSLQKADILAKLLGK
eukprot:13524137-Ditylum_brightwellii.AAC.1